jgi:hypothetical protein
MLGGACNLDRGAIQAHITSLRLPPGKVSHAASSDKARGPNAYSVPSRVTGPISPDGRSGDVAGYVGKVV